MKKMNEEKYHYPDENDRLTIQLIDNEYDGAYWAASETNVIDQWMQTLSVRSASPGSAGTGDSAALTGSRESGSSAPAAAPAGSGQIPPSMGLPESANSAPAADPADALDLPPSAAPASSDQPSMGPPESANSAPVADPADSLDLPPSTAPAGPAHPAPANAAHSNDRPPLTMLDLGCGTGRIFEVFARSGFVGSITGVEPDPDRFASACRSAERIDAPCRITVIKGDASSLPAGSRFDVVLSSHVLQHIRTRMAADLLVQMADLLKPEGLILLTTTYAHGSRDLFFKESMQEDGSRRSEETDIIGFDEAYHEEGILPVRMFSRKSLEQMVEDAGLDLILYGCYHFAGHHTVSEDDQANAAGNTQDARDSFCIFRKREQR